ncbi:hypothetical protein [Nitrosococcus wardiae]|uniref:Uncharacterized protein n=1 Tax=Nitrosococcus wardiae TaxID=1814290 RepID=A0A4P7C1D2_9GAMM|nr:hypothetical protein [Nitrosococcus wardiae]QBQ53075.1 hypothetical protein E3U44_00055 [Nitrosococcus wardiae]QBQ56355.1 hypothetical protein E3U44_19015 [Nitrosococcus wardiae]QBQ56373.1 hypothetical protein E3U44_19105 [Nitrosococcus wardiae]
MDNNTKAFMIQAYFDDLEARIKFLPRLREEGHPDEALMLCCCYIEALGSRKHHQSSRKLKNYARILEEDSGNLLFSLVHPKRLRLVIQNAKPFKVDLSKIEPLIDQFGNELQPQQVVRDKLSGNLSDRQESWLQENLFKGTIAAISYERVRSELVHDISAGTVTFSESTFNGNPVPDLDFELLYQALINIFENIKKRSIEANAWYWEQNA